MNSTVHQGYGFRLSPHDGLALLLVLAIVILLPFSTALEVHHFFAEMDHDGHEHSDFDLCQWVEQHTSNSFTMPLIVVAAPLLQEIFSFHHYSIEHDQSLRNAIFSPRGPPVI